MTPDPDAVLAELQQSAAACAFPWCGGGCDWDLEDSDPAPAVFVRYHCRRWSSGVVLAQLEYAAGTDPEYVADEDQPSVTIDVGSEWGAELRLDGSSGPGLQDLDAVARFARDLLAAVECANASRVA